MDLPRYALLVLGVLIVAPMAGLVYGLLNAPESDWDFHAQNTTKVVFEDGTTCFYHRAWRAMSCIHVEPYGPAKPVTLPSSLPPTR
ncbi:MAG: hypothetical protein EB084_09395 [Proteobacteria bacterium]|nr:hypothetical protein [Pseudomonadota bacterium]